MAEWGKGTERYAEMMLHRARVAVETEGRIGALLWYQVRGERHRTEYGCWMGMLVRDLRADIGIPHLLVIQECRKRTLQMVIQCKKGDELMIPCLPRESAIMTLLSIYGGQMKSIFHKKLQCQSCRHYSQHPIFYILRYLY